MIINIRGTSGSGKSTLVRRIMKMYEVKSAFKIEGRKQPIGYLLSKKGQDPSLAIIGHYETDCGGCDTISLRLESFRLVREAHDQGYDVLFEGLLISDEVNYTSALHKDGMDLVVIGMNKVELNVCLNGVNQRRFNADQARRDKVAGINLERFKKGLKPKNIPEYRGNVNPKNTTKRVPVINRAMNRLSDAGVTVYSCDREEAFTRICAELNL